MGRDKQQQRRLEAIEIWKDEKACGDGKRGRDATLACEMDCAGHEEMIYMAPSPLYNYAFNTLFLFSSN